jgi:hypothetical protein
MHSSFPHGSFQLVTGRTHQLRLQAAAENASILDDSRYNPVQGMVCVCGHRCYSAMAGHAEDWVTPCRGCGGRRGSIGQGPCGRAQ